MTTIVLEYPVDETRELVKAAFENTEEIAQYHDDGNEIVGKTGPQATNSGSIVTVTIAHDESSEDETVIVVDAEREIATQPTAKPDQRKSEFVQQLDAVGSKGIAASYEETDGPSPTNASKEVENPDELYDVWSDLRKNAKIWGLPALVALVVYSYLLVTYEDHIMTISVAGIALVLVVQIAYKMTR